MTVLNAASVGRSGEKLATRLVAAGTGFNMVLCFISTHAHAIGAAELAVVELAILGAALLSVWRTLDRDTWCIAGLTVGWIASVHIIDPVLGPNILIALAIPPIFFALGRRYGTPDIGDRMVLVLSLVVVTFGLFELLDLSMFERLFDVIGYYVNKGGTDRSQVNVTGTHLFVSGIRPAGEGRSLLPALGAHRVSSLFLEPISAGNFAVVAALWAMARYPAQSRRTYVILALAALIAILADSRLAIGCGLCIMVGLCTPLPRLRVVLLMLPLILVATLVLIGWTSGPRAIDDTLGGRLYSSGTLLASWDIAQWIGIERSQGIEDSGYAQLFVGLGVVPAAMLWSLVALRTEPTALASRMRCALAIYLTLSLCITGSVLSIKTGALVWFLYGTSQNPLPRLPVRQVPPTPLTASIPA
jgi:putative polymerase